ncbi:ATP-binding protein [Chitinophaga niabensis]|uniref:histidine kinase n=1 Tax=Chitinophaga niabensis TaxID=536979 RepID=A0A1N6G1Z3_9BACT|nr:ATP-binding protein [Chitinophaga niabensis]SIO01538.1 Signal transduction histidine kinase [Chitinophaga niabensis]
MKTSTLQERIRALEKENASLRNHYTLHADEPSVKVPAEFLPLFQKAEENVKQYFSHISLNPSQGTIEISNERYVLIRASALSKDFLGSILSLYADRGENEAFGIGRNFLFDIAHALGINDAKAFHAQMNVTDPLSKLSAGPIHFAYTGWAFVDILPESHPTPDDDYYLAYHHPFSFEADSWIRSGEKAKSPVCIMSTGYSSGWCEESFGIPLTAVEVTCRAKGDEHCTFIMSPPHKIEEHIQRFAKTHRKHRIAKTPPEIPTFFVRKTMEEQMEKARQLAEESSKAKSDFVANMSHELRTPLSAILGFTELLKKTKLNSRQTEYLDAICTSGSNLLSTINDIMDLSKLDAKKISFESVPVNLPELLQSIEMMLASKVRHKKLEYKSNISKQLHKPLLSDSVRLTQILLNIIGNAIKFTEKGSITVGCTVLDETPQAMQVEFSVKDTGIGIPAAKQQQVFERFTQADTAITRKYGGSGLGLAITRELVELLGGSITLSSKPNKGTEFKVQLPFIKAGKQVKGAASRAQTVDGKGLHILVVEDNLLNQKMTRIMLTNNGFTVSGADSGTKAIAFLQKNKVDLILMDLQIPGMDGYLTTQKIRENLKLGTPMIAITAHAFSGERERCLAAGMNDYLPKPFREQELLKAITANLPKTITDLSFLREQTRNNIPFIREMINTFIKQTPKDLAALQKAMKENNGEMIYKVAHTMSTSVGYFGLKQHIGKDLVHMQQKRLADEKRFLKVKKVCEQAIKELQQLTPSALSSAS